MVEKGFAPSRTKAQDLIKSGSVCLKLAGRLQTVDSSSTLVNSSENPEIVIQTNPLDRYVSRGGLKLEGALNELNLSVQGSVGLDVGISTGGFADCLLQKGLARLVGVDVGHNQLNLKIKSDPRVVAFEGINAREIHLNASVQSNKPTYGFDLAVVDVSFISLTLVLGSISELISSGGWVLALVKPQFEVGPANLSKNGIVKDVDLYRQVREKIEKCVQDLNVCDPEDIRFFESQIEGKDGNKEFFIFFKKN
jgi:23S rRNA (cytidine1920-2'-O)/16S rRNA (cytidine1409-2'-O)-methyltransferase